MTKEKDKELIDDIVDKMKAHELPYLEGAWEKFASNHTTLVSKKQVNWKYWSAAAAVLCIAGASFLYLRHLPQKDLPAVARIKLVEELVEQKDDLDTTIDSPTWSFSDPKTNRAEANSNSIDQSPVRTIDHDEYNMLADGHDFSFSTPTFHDHDQKNDFIDPQPSTIKDVVETKREGVKDHNLVTNSSVNKNKETTRSIAEKLESLGSLYPGNSEKHDFASAIKKWEIGAFVSPSSTVDKMSLGGGLSLAYQVSDKISIRSGVSMQQYGAGANRQNNLSAVQSASMSYNAAVSNNPVIKNDESLLLAKQQAPDKELSAVNNKLLTIDIPVDVRYHVTKSFYTSVGVSYVGVLDQTQENYFVNGINEHTAADNGNAVYAPENMKQSFKGNAVNTNEFNGFVNFSVGKKMQVGKKLSVAVEPFVKLPVGGLKSTDLNYTNGGLKVVTSF
ncbi:hypothetical protein [Sphingobacterium faecium]|uniref:hypothetical protein n=1 Tax=Sphingobacterium faecium TaxID=34087 RepID=UPI003207DB05